ncbi:hypothetical protein [Herbidospora mongoliensis]|uniref:hypothetical protein n=1 Tax=Herbidospora mongoliensis TaxID=688067 RepID=UPI0012F78269|nr:hypothetical protein [Herbidospora mongoliensis]
MDFQNATLSADGARLLTSGGPYSAALWDVSDPETPHALPLPAPEPFGSAYEVPLASAGSRALTSDSWLDSINTHDFSGSVTLWDFTALSHPLDSACAIIGKGLTREEWDRYLPAIPYHEICPPENPRPLPIHATNHPTSKLLPLNTRNEPRNIGNMTI